MDFRAYDRLGMSAALVMSVLVEGFTSIIPFLLTDFIGLSGLPLSQRLAYYRRLGTLIRPDSRTGVFAFILLPVRQHRAVSVLRLPCDC